MCPHTWSHIKISQTKRVETDKNKIQNISIPIFHSTAYQDVPGNSIFLLLWNLGGAYFQAILHKRCLSLTLI